MNELLVIDEAAKRLRLTTRGIRFLVRSGQLGHLRLGRRLYFSEADIDALIQSRHVEPRDAKAGA